MKHFFSILILVAILLVLWACDKKQADIIYDKSYIDEIKLVRKDIALYITRNYIPGATFAIAKENKLIYSEGMGYASKDLDVPMARENKLRIGDVSELFTCIIYLKLVEEGVLNPDSTVQHYIHDYPATNFELAIKYLPYHTSGIRKEYPSENDWSGLNINIQKGLENFMNDPLNSPPGSSEELSMLNTNLLGAVMEKATNKKFPELLKEYVTAPLHLTNTIVDNPFATIKGRSDFYDLDMLAQCINAPFRDMRYKAPSKGVLSNAEDLVKFGMAILESDYFSNEFKENLFKPADLYGGFKSNMANGWMLLRDSQGRAMYGRYGGVTGGGASILIHPQEKLVIAGVINLTLTKDNMPVFQIANHFLEIPKSDEKVETELPE
ncbi:MAG: beta-lactamase family protein [Draconibacterium sp.]|nr:beta-lactamase family protein [Draconibacterium sp.]